MGMSYKLSKASPYIFLLIGFVALYFIIGLEQTIWIVVAVILAIILNRVSVAIAVREHPGRLAAIHEGKKYIEWAAFPRILAFLVWPGTPVFLFIRYGWKAPLAFLILSFLFGIMFVIRGDLYGGWDKIREDLITSIMQVSPVFKERYRSYLKHIDDDSSWGIEWERYPEEVRDAGALHLLCASIIDCGVLSLDADVSTYGVRFLLSKSLPLLDQVLTQLVQKEKWNDIYTFNVAGLLAIASNNALRRSEDNALVPGGMEAAKIRGLYAQGAAAFHRDDLQTAGKAWVRCEIDVKSSDEPAFKLCLEGLEKHFPAFRRRS